MAENMLPFVPLCFHFARLTLIPTFVGLSYSPLHSHISLTQLQEQKCINADQDGDEVSKVGRRSEKGEI